MKIALVVVTCLVAVSVAYQQRYFWAPIPAYSPKINYMPFYMDQQDDPVSQYAPDGSQVEGLEQYQDNISRSKPQRRFFSFFPLSNFINPAAPIPTVTSVVLATVSSTLTTAVVSSCIPLAQFSVVAAVGAAPASTLTTTCARRRRSIDSYPFEAHDEVKVSPAQPEIVVASQMPELREMRSTDNHPDLLSSIEYPSDLSIQPLAKRQHRALNLIVTVTSTVTSFSFAQTVVKKTLSLAGAGQLQCLPAGFTIC